MAEKKTATGRKKLLLLLPIGFACTVTSVATLAAIGLPAMLHAQRIERPALVISGYVIDAEIDTATHHLAAKST